MDRDPKADAHAALPLHAMGNVEVAERIRRSAHTARALGRLLSRPSVQHADLHPVLAEAMRHGVVTTAEAEHFLRNLPRDPGPLRVALTHVHQMAVHAGDALRKEQLSRLWGQPPGASVARAAA